MHQEWSCKNILFWLKFRRWKLHESPIYIIVPNLLHYKDCSDHASMPSTSSPSDKHEFEHLPTPYSKTGSPPISNEALEAWLENTHAHSLVCTHTHFLRLHKHMSEVTSMLLSPLPLHNNHSEPYVLHLFTHVHTIQNCTLAHTLP